MRVSRRAVIAGSAALAACGRTDPFEFGDEDEEDGEDEPMNAEKEAFRSTDSNPIFLTANSTIASNSTGGVNSASLKNPTGGPMEVLEIRFQVKTDANYGSGVGGGFLGCQLDLGKFALTNGFVPVWNFGRADSLIVESVGGTVATTSTYGEYTWRLSKPLYVPAGAVIVPKFQHRGLFKNQISVFVSYSGRTVSPKFKPKSVHLPYAAAYASKVFNYNETGTDNSTETDLVNPHGEQLNLSCFTGRIVNVDTQSLFALEAPIGSSTGGEECGARSLLARMVDMNGRPIVSSFTPFRQAFGALTRSWEMGYKQVMDPISYYTVFLQKNLPLVNSTNPQLIQAFVGMVGWRDIVFSKDAEQLALSGEEIE